MGCTPGRGASGEPFYSWSLGFLTCDMEVTAFTTEVVQGPDKCGHHGAL